MSVIRWIDQPTRQTILLLSLLPRLTANRLQYLNTRLSQGVAGLEHLNQDLQRKLGLDQEQTELLRHHSQSALFGKAISWHKPEDNQYIITLYDAVYPTLLREIARPPLALFLKGNLQRLDEVQIAIVGSRNPTMSGRQLAQYFAAQLAALQITVTSGLAMGIDAIAHNGALDVGGKTLAVLGCGIDVVYPQRNKALYAKLIDNDGLLVSEFMPSTPALASHFPRRNRIVSGLSLGTLVIEAARRSGSLITARTALEQNREVFAVPGNVINPTAAGCNYLIQQGAKLVTKIEDILEEYQHFNHHLSKCSQKHSKKNDASRLATDRLLDSVDKDVTSIDVIAERNKLSVHAVMAALLEYELQGLVASVPGGYIKLRGK
jgi:DNA processing protein